MKSGLPLFHLPAQVVGTEAALRGDRSMTVVDLCRRRRSASCDGIRTGRPFINPASRVGRSRPHRFFFRRNSEAPELHPTIGSLVSAVRALAPSQASRVAMSLHLSPATQQKLLEFVSRIASQDDEMIATVNSRIACVCYGGSEPAPRAREHDFFDYRYDQSSSENDLKFRLSDRPLDLHVTIPVLRAERVVLQCFVAGMSPPMVQWPMSLRIFVNGHQIKPPGTFRFPLIYLTPFGSGSSLRILFDVDGCEYLMMLRHAEYRSFSDIVRDIERERTVNDSISDLDTFVFSPMTGEIMKHPGRGRNCTHVQCFDLKEFLKTATRTSMWTCPICRAPTYVEDLVSSAAMRKILCEVNPSQVEGPALGHPMPGIDDIFGQDEYSWFYP